MNQTSSAAGILPKRLGKVQLFTLSFGTIVGVGWITVMGEWLGQAGSLGSIVAFLLGGGLMILVGLCYGELAAAYPVTGGELVYGYKLLGPKIAYVIGLILVLNFTIVCSFEAVSVGWLATALWPGLEGRELYHVLGQEVHAGSLVLGVLGTVGIALLNYYGAKLSSKFQDVMTCILVVVTLIFVGFGLVGGDWANLRPYWGSANGGAMIPWGGVLLVVATAPFWFNGFGTIPQALGEKSAVTSPRQVTAAIVLSIVAAMVFYCAVILSAAVAAPRDQLLAAKLPAAEAFAVAFKSPLLGKVVLFAGMLGLITTWNAVFFAATRVLFALGRCGYAAPALAAVHPRFGSPANAVWVVAALSFVPVLLGKGVIIPIVSASGIAMAAVFGLMCWGVLRLRAKEKARGTKIVAWGGMAGSAFMLYQALLQSRPLGGGWPVEWLLLGTGLLMGMAGWVWFRRQREAMNERRREELLMGMGDSPREAQFEVR